MVQASRDTQASAKAATRAPRAATDAVEMHEIRLVGRGGQGVVTAGELLGRAAVAEGCHAQSLPTFGPERRGALSQTTLRIGRREILLKCTQAQPNVLLVLDPTIWHFANVLLGARAGAKLIFNSPRPPAEIDEELRSGRYGYQPPSDYQLYVVDATGIALELLGRPITNTAMMGALSGATGVVSMASIETALEGRFGSKAALNIEAARAAREGLARLGG